MTKQDLLDYIASVERPGFETLTLAEAWDDFADAYGWDAKENPYA